MSVLIPVQALTSRGDWFRCEPMRASFKAGTCLSRQQLANAPRVPKPGSPRENPYEICKACDLGRQVAAVLAGQPYVPPAPVPSPAAQTHAENKRRALERGVARRAQAALDLQVDAPDAGPRVSVPGPKACAAERCVRPASARRPDGLCSTHRGMYKQMAKRKSSTHGRVVHRSPRPAPPAPEPEEPPMPVEHLAPEPEPTPRHWAPTAHVGRVMAPPPDAVCTVAGCTEPPGLVMNAGTRVTPLELAGLCGQHRHRHMGTTAWRKAHPPKHRAPKKTSAPAPQPPKPAPAKPGGGARSLVAAEALAGAYKRARKGGNSAAPMRVALLIADQLVDYLLDGAK